MVPFTSGIIVNSTPLKHDYAEWLGIDEGRIAVCPNGIDPVTVSPRTAAQIRSQVREQFGLDDDTLLLINVGRFSAEKGQMSLMQANRVLLERPPGRRFVWLLCGDGPTMDEVQQFTREHAMRNVVFAGRTDRVRDYLLAADIFVMPSDFEGMPNAMMEAMAQGLASVSTDVSGALDVARDGQEALYFAPRDTPHLVQHLEYLFTHDEERRRMGQRAQVRMQEFTVARAVTRFTEALVVIRDAADRPGVPRSSSMEPTQ
jgi:glycosyltransferase involved in cell wall biosynthesis